MIILTGASGGLGQAIINQLSEIEPVVGLYNNNLPAENYNPKITYKKLSLPDYKIDINPDHITLIHLAAVKIDELAIVVDEKNWDKVFNVNVKGAFFLTQALLKTMMRDKWGRIIFVISSGLGDLGTLTYSTSKSGLLRMSEVFSREYARSGITSNILQLGYFNTGLWNQLSQVKKDELLNQIPSKKLGNPKAIVDQIKTIIDNDFLNGGVYNIDGGV